MSLEGQQLGEFEILERIGQGGMGAVYKARQVSLDRFVAIKTLQKALADDPEYIVRFRQEAKAAALLNHPNLVQVYSAGESDGLHWFAMEYVEGESANARLKRKGKLDPLEALAIAIHVATALEHGWRKASLIHRDIKPDNIFLSTDGEVKLGDLGLAKSAGQAESLTTTGVSMGTPHYISPEQVQAMKDVDLRADIYSLGCTLFHLLSGKAPFEGNGAVAIMMKHVHDPVPDVRTAWPECSPLLADVVGTMMQKEPERRQQNYNEVINDLRQARDVLSGGNVAKAISQKKATERLPTQSVTSQSKAPRRSDLRLFAGIGVGTLATAIALFFHFKPKPQTEGNGASTVSSLATATRIAPFVNSLGMEFVPVPIIGGPTAGQRVLFSIWDTRVQDYEVFVRETKREWPKVDFPQSTTNPATNLSWEDAKLFCQWLTAHEHAEGRLPVGSSYRLPSDHEWSCAVGIAGEDAGKLPAEKHNRIDDAYPWDGGWPPPAGSGNYAGEELRQMQLAGNNVNIKGIISDYNDGFVATSPVGSFKANRFGLFDMGGNVWQWCEDWINKDQKQRVLRGAAWNNFVRPHLLSSDRGADGPGHRNTDDGFRCVIAPIPAATVSSTSPKAATKDSPFVNTLGMKFVPVPGTKVLFSIWDTRVQDYGAYARINNVDDAWTKQQKDGVPISREPGCPVVGMSWEDATAFCQWLTEKEMKEGKLSSGAKYRLPLDEEWSWAVGMPLESGATPAQKHWNNGVDFPWGKEYPPIRKVGNFADEAFHAKFPLKEYANAEWNKNRWIEGYADGYATTSPVGSFPPNAYGLYDMSGNVFQWCEDWYEPSHKSRVWRGSSWSGFDRDYLLSSNRGAFEPSFRNYTSGFRCVLELSVN